MEWVNAAPVCEAIQEVESAAKNRQVGRGPGNTEVAVDKLDRRNPGRGSDAGGFQLSAGNWR